jgi:hypothetical protein
MRIFTQAIDINCLFSPETPRLSPIQAVHQHVFSSTNSSTPWREPSWPMPDSFTPPMGQPLTIADSALAQGLEALKTLDPFVVLYYSHLFDLCKPL